MPFTCKPWHDHTSTEFEHQRYSDRNKGTFDIKLEVTLVRKFFLRVNASGNPLHTNLKDMQETENLINSRPVT